LGVKGEAMGWKILQTAIVFVVLAAQLYLFGLVNPPNGFVALVFVSIAVLVAAGVTWLLTALRDRWQHRKSRQGA
jgi:type III secretory pathway component EscV